MRILPVALGVLLLLALLTWLLLRGIDTNAPAYAMTLKAFDDFALAEASLQRDVLPARAGLLRNYDTWSRPRRRSRTRSPGFAPTLSESASILARSIAWQRRSHNRRS